MSLLVEEQSCPSSELDNCHVRELVAAFVYCCSVGVIFPTLEVGCIHADEFASSSLQGINLHLKVSDIPTFLQFPFNVVVHRISSRECVAAFEVLKSYLISRDVLAVHCCGKKTEKSLIFILGAAIIAPQDERFCISLHLEEAPICRAADVIDVSTGNGLIPHNCNVIT